MITLVTLLVVFLVIFFMADIRSFFTPKDTIHVVMPSAAGLRAGGPVWIAGQPVGEVENIEVRPPDVDSTERVIVETSIRRKHMEHIRRDSHARITTFRMIGDPVLDISPGTPSQPAIEDGDTLRVRAGGTPAAALERATSLQASLRELVNESRQLGTSAQNRSAQARRITARLSETSRELRAFTGAVREGPFNTFSDPEFKRIVASLGEMVGELRASFTRASERARAAQADAEPTLRRLAARADTIQAQIAQLQNAIDAGGGGLLIRAQTDTAIVKALHEAQVQLDSLIAETKRNPLRFWF